jgi:hypothetical protein
MSALMFDIFTIASSIFKFGLRNFNGWRKKMKQKTTIRNLTKLAQLQMPVLVQYDG